MSVTSCKSDIEKRAFSIDEFSERWGWGRNTTYDLINKGRLKSAKVGRRRVITRQHEADFEAALGGKSQ
jgi:excisionase family DNA binding protein